MFVEGGQAPFSRTKTEPVPTVLRSLNLDTTRLGLGDLGDRELEYAVLELRLDGVGLHVLRQRKRPYELAAHALDARVVTVDVTLFDLAFTAQRQHALVSGDFDVGGLHARQIGAHDEALC